MLSPEQLKMRLTGLGGSDIAAALGQSPWKTQLQLWAEKRGEIKDVKMNPAMEWGHRLESPIYGKFASEHSELKLSHASGTVRHKEYPYLLATPDGFISKRDGATGILEIKTSGQSIWDEVPFHYMLQVQHYMYVLNRSFAYFAVLFRGVEYREYGPFLMNREEYEKIVLPGLTEFWTAVDKQVPVFSPSNLADLSFCAPLDDGQSALISDEAMYDLVYNIRGGQEAKKKLDKQLKTSKFELAKLMGNHRRLVDDEDNTLATQVQTADSIIVDSGKLQAEEPETFQKFSKVRKGYRSLRVYS